VGDVQFGSTRANYAQLAIGIKTYTEQIEGGEMIEQLQDEVDQAGCIVTLGFAYHDQNMRLLKPAHQMPLKPVYGTAFGLSDSDVNVTAGQIEGWFTGRGLTEPKHQKQIHLENKLKCADLFDFYAKSLTGDGA
jgi:hypothetical protein